MRKLADDQTEGTGPDTSPDVSRAVAGLAVEIRGAVTPVIGYLELISEEANAISPGGDPASADRHLRWIATIERRLETMRELNDQVSRVCAVLRDTVNDRAAAPRPAPGAREG
jgi:hypothetical protein